MNERQMQFRVGVVVFATMIVGGLLAMLNGPVPTDWLPGRESYQIGIQVPEAPGVGPNTPVRKNGLLIGRVESIEDLDDGVVLRVKIDGERRLMTNHVPHIRTSVLGDATIDFTSEPPAAPPQPLPDGATIRGVVDPNPFDSIAKLGDLQDDIQTTMQALARAGTEVANVAERIDDAFGTETEEGRVKRLLDTTEVAMAQFAQTMSAINQIIGDDPVGDVSPATGQPAAFRQAPADAQPLPGGRAVPDQQPRPGGQQPGFQQPGLQQPPGQQPIDGQQLRQRLREGLNELPDAVREARTAMQEFRVVLESANRNFENLEGFTEPLGQKGEQIADSIIEAVDGLDRLVEEFTVLSQALNNREGTLGQLIHSGQLHENLNRLIHNANQVVLNVNDLTVRLKPVVNDARIFMDKVAREPGRVVTGGLNPSVVK